MPDSDALLLDRLIHEPARLAIMMVLSSVNAADFVFLARTTGLTNGNLSSHLTKLEDAGLIRIEKRFVHKRPGVHMRLNPWSGGTVMTAADALPRGLPVLVEPERPGWAVPTASFGALLEGPSARWPQVKFAVSLRPRRPRP